jgi:hypothetical protein
MMPVSPPSTRMKKKPSTNSSGVLNAACRSERRDPAEDLHAVGIAIIMLAP